MLTPREFRSHFPIFESRIHLNSCSKGALSEEVQQAYKSYLDAWGTGGSPWEEWMAVAERVRSAAAVHFGCSPDELALTFCASTAINTLVSALDFRGRRNQIALGDLEFPTMAHICLAQEKRGRVSSGFNEKATKALLRAS